MKTSSTPSSRRWHRVRDWQRRPAPEPDGLEAALAAVAGNVAATTPCLPLVRAPWRTGIDVARSTGTAVTLFCGEPSMTRSEQVRYTSVLRGASTMRTTRRRLKTSEVLVVGIDDDLVIGADELEHRTRSPPRRSSITRSTRICGDGTQRCPSAATATRCEKSEFTRMIGSECRRHDIGAAPGPQVDPQLRPVITPPSTSQMAPVTQSALLDSRNTMTSATSCGVPMRPIGWKALKPCNVLATSAFGMKPS